MESSHEKHRTPVNSPEKSDDLFGLPQPVDRISQNMSHNPASLDNEVAEQDSLLPSSGSQPRTRDNDSFSRAYDNVPFLAKYALELVLVLFVFPDNLLVTPMSDAFMQKACRYHLHYNETICSHLDDHKTLKELVQIESNYYSTLKNIVATLPGCVISLMAGQYMSRYGMRAPVLLAIMGRATSTLLQTYTFYDMELSLKYNVLAEIPAAITGDMIVVMTAVYSYITLSCPASRRQTRFLWVQFATFVPLLIAMSFGGALYDHYHIPMLYLQLGTAVSYILPLIALVVMYRERVLSPEAKSDSCCEMIHHSAGISVLRRSFRYLVRPRPDFARAQLYAMFICLVIAIIAFSGTTELNYYYVNLIYEWQVLDFTLVGAVANALTILIAIPNLLLFRWLALTDPMMAAICFLCYAMKFALMAMAALSVYIYYAQIIPGLPFMVLNISVRSHISRLLATEEVPVVFAVLSASEHLFPIGSDWINMLLYKWAIPYFPGLPFAVTSVLFLVAVVLASLCARWTRKYGYPTYDDTSRTD